MSLRAFDPRRKVPGATSQPAKVAKPAKVELPHPSSLAALAALAASPPSPEHDAAVLDTICRAENAFSYDAMADEAELCVRGERA
jgi:hypothetical protein